MFRSLFATGSSRVSPKPSEWEQLVEREPWVLDDELYRARIHAQEQAELQRRQQQTTAQVGGNAQLACIKRAVFDPWPLLDRERRHRILGELLTEGEATDFVWGGSDLENGIRYLLTKEVKITPLVDSIPRLDEWVGAYHAKYEEHATLSFVVPRVVGRLSDETAITYLERFWTSADILNRWQPISSREHELCQEWQARFAGSSLEPLLAAALEPEAVGVSS